MSSLVNNNPHNIVTKNDFQINDYLKNFWYDYKDWDCIVLFCNLKGRIITAQRNDKWNGYEGRFVDFFQWYYNGFGFGDIVKYKNGYAVMDSYDYDGAHVQLYPYENRGYDWERNQWVNEDDLKHLTKSEIITAKLDF